MSADVEIANCMTLQLEDLAMDDANGSGEDENVDVDIVDDEKFTDTKFLVPPKSLKELVRRLHKIFAHDDINIDYVRTLMESYKSNPRDWKRFAKFDTHRYTRNLVDEGNGKFNLLVLCWNEAQGSSIHSHAGSHCFLKVLKGDVIEEMYDWPEQTLITEEIHKDTQISDETSKGSEMNLRTELTFHENQCTYISDDIGLHRVENPSHTDKAVTLHLYSPPFTECYSFDQRTGKRVKATVTFWSKFGRRTPFGKNPSSTSTHDKENN